MFWLYYQQTNLARYHSMTFAEHLPLVAMWVSIPCLHTFLSRSVIFKRMLWMEQHYTLVKRATRDPGLWSQLSDTLPRAFQIPFNFNNKRMLVLQKIWGSSAPAAFPSVAEDDVFSCVR
jgi:hypothetical protein